MATQVLMPALSPTMEEGTLAKWLVKEGDTVKSGQILAEIETDKATMEFEAVDEGVVGKILVAEGTAGVKVNTPIAVLVEEGETVSDAPAPAAVAAVAVAAEAPVASPTVVSAPAPAPVVAQGWPHSDLPEGPTKTMTVREALREAMAEEMRADPTVFLMGEEVGEYQGAYKISQGLLDEFGPRRVVDTPITEMGFAGIGVRVHDLQLLDAGDGPHHQLGGQDAVHVGGPDGLAHGVPGAERGGGAGWGAAFSGLRGLVCGHSGAAGLHALFGGGCEGSVEDRDP